MIALIVLLLVVTSNYVDRSLLGILQEPLKQELKFSDWQLGLISGPAFAIFYALSGLPSARWAEGRNRATVLAFLLACWSAMTAMCGAAQSFLHLALSSAGVGLGEGGCIPISHALISEHFAARQRGMAMAVLSCASPLGGIIAAVGGAAIADAWGWRMAFVVLGVPGLVLALVVRLLITDPRAAELRAAAAARPRFREDLAWLFRNRTFVLLAVANAVNSIANSGVMMFTASYFLRQYNLGLKEVGLIYAAGIGIAGLAGTLASGVLADRFAGRNGRSYALVPAVGAGMAAILFLGAFTQEVWWISVILLIGANFATDLKTPSLAAVQSLAPRRMRATAAAVLFMGITFCGAGLGPPIAGLISDLVAGQTFGSFGDFGQLCPGGVAAAPGAVDDQCRAASAAGVRVGLIAAASLYFVSTLLFYLSSRGMRLNLNDDDNAE